MNNDSIISDHQRLRQLLKQKKRQATDSMLLQEFSGAFSAQSRTFLSQKALDVLSDTALFNTRCHNPLRLVTLNGFPLPRG